MNCIVMLSLVVVLTLFSPQIKAAEVTVAGKLTAVNVATRIITVLPKKAGEKSLEIEVSRKAEITVNGKEAAFKALKVGQDVKVTYNDKLEIVSAIAVENAEIPTGDKNRTPVPSQAEQTAAQKLVKDIFKDEYQKAKTSAGKQALARKLFSQGIETKDDPNARFVLFREACDIGAESGDLATALKAADAIAESYEIDALQMKADALTLASKFAPPASRKAVVEGALGLIEEAIRADNFDYASRFATLALAASTSANVPSLTQKASAQLKEVHERQKAFHRVQPFLATLKDKPTDPEANGEVGKYHCLVKGDWEKGLPMVALGGSPTLKALAERELAQPSDVKEQLKLADAYWDFGETTADVQKGNIRRHAVGWYKKCLPLLTGISKAKVEKRIGLLPDVADTISTEPVGEIRQFRGHTGPVQSVAFSPDGRLVLSGSRDRSARLWDVATGKELNILKGHSEPVWAVSFLPSGNIAVTAGFDLTARLWNVGTGREVYKITELNGWITGLAVAKDGRRVLVGTDTGFLYSFDPQIKKMLPGGIKLPNLKYLSHLAIFPDGKNVLASSEGMWICDLAKSREVLKFEIDRRYVTSSALSPDGKLALTSDVSGNVILWDTSNGKQVRRFDSHPESVHCVAFSPDGRFALSGSGGQMKTINIITPGTDNTVRLWEVATGKELHKFEGHTDAVLCVAVSPDGRSAISGSLDASIRLWRLP